MLLNKYSIFAKASCQTVGILAAAWLLSGCTTNNVDLARMGFPGAADVQVYDIRQAGMGLAPEDGITVLVDTLEREYSAELEEEVASCIRDSFSKPDLPAVRVVFPQEFRSVAFPNLTPEQVLAEQWDQRLVDPAFRERIAPMGLRYLLAVTVSQGKSPTESKGSYWKWQRFAVISTRVVDLAHARAAGKVSASVRKTSAAGQYYLYPPPIAILFVNPSFVEGQACQEFGNAVVEFLLSEERPPQVIMSSLTLENIFPQRQQEGDRGVYIAANGNRSTNLNTMTLAKETSVPGRAKTTETDEVAATSRWEEVRPLIKGRKELVVHEDANARRPTRGYGFQNDFCDEVKLSLNTLTLNTKELPPLPSHWHLVPVWIAKAVSLPVQLAGPVAAIIVAPFSPPAAVWGLETLYNCLTERQDDRKKGHDNSTSVNGTPIVNSATPVNLNSTIPTESIFKSQAHNDTGIHSAAETGDVRKVQLLIKENKELVNAKNKSALTPLHLAAINGRKAVVEVLLANNAELNSRDWQGATPLKLAATNGYTDIVDLLRERGAKD